MSGNESLKQLEQQLAAEQELSRQLECKLKAKDAELLSLTSELCSPTFGCRTKNQALSGTLSCTLGPHAFFA